jgi:hypothetical protein
VGVDAARHHEQAGRVHDVLTREGLQVSAHPVDRAISGHPDVRRALAVDVDHGPSAEQHGRQDPISHRRRPVTSAPVHERVTRRS